LASLPRVDNVIRRARRDAFAGLSRDADVAALYHTDVGIKARNQLVSSDLLVYPFLPRREPAETDPALLTLGIDGLRDEFTLLGTSVADSPHLALMRTLDEGRGVGDDSYVARVEVGTLDLRPPRKAARAFRERLRESFDAAAQALDRGETPVVKVVRLGDSTYVADGKHRAALAAYRGASVACEDVTPIYYDSFFAWMERVMARRPASFAKHLALFVELARARSLAGAAS
jgi:hypothetical protein